MVPMDGTVVHLEVAWVWNKALDTVYESQLRGYILSTDTRDGSSGKKDRLVVTPGGPRPRDSVHVVRPGEIVRRNADGTYTVVPKEAPVSIEKREELKRKK